VQLQTDDLSNFALIDQHEYERNYALESLRFTFAVCVMLGVLIMYFAADIKHMSSSNCLHPLWDLMDDMNAMKLIELLTASQNQSTQHTPEGFKQLSRSLMGRRRLPCRAFSPVPVAQELLGLRKSMSLLEAAMVAWSKYVPVVLLNQLMVAGIEAKIGCVLSEVSIMFCDVQGFKDLVDGKGPQEVLSVLNVVLTEVNRALEENSGTLLEFIGDEVLAVFNAPRKIAGHSQAAVNAAVSAVEYAAKIPGQPVRLQCSVHTGTVLAGNLGSPTRMKYGVLGDGVNLAARLKGLNSRYGTQLLVSADAMSYINCQDLVQRTIGKLILKGRTTPTHTYEVLGRRGNLPKNLQLGAESHDEAFESFVQGRFEEAKAMFQEAQELLTEGLEPKQDRPTTHMMELCEKYLENPPDADTWDGSEHLKKKAW
jgi:adenylate cyclase